MKKLLSLLLAATLMLSLAACSSESASSEADDSETPVSSGDAEVKDSLIIAHKGDTPNFDTHDNLNDNGMRINLNIYDPLVRMHNTTYEISPCVAESWSISEDGKEYTFKIKEGIKFSDGTDLSVDDVVFSLQRGMEMPLAVPSFARVVGVEKVDEANVKVILDGPYPEFLFAMALPTAGILSETAYNELGAEEYMKSPITTGPYVVSEWSVGEKVELVANENYHMGEVPIKNVEFRVISDDNAAVLSLESGDIDALVDAPFTAYNRISENSELALHEGTTFGYNYILFNTASGPFADPKAREAMAYATDKEAILFAAFDGYGHIIDTPALPEYVGYTDEVTKYAYDLEMAKTLFAEAGINAGDEIVVTSYEPVCAKVSQVLQNSLAEIDINLKIETLERAAYTEKMTDGDFHMTTSNCTFTSPTIDEAVFTMIHSGEIGQGNYGGYQNEVVDRTLEEARASLDQSERAIIYNELLIEMSNDLPMIPTIWRVKNISADANLKGVECNPWSFYNIYDFSW